MEPLIANLLKPSRISFEPSASPVEPSVASIEKNFLSTIKNVQCWFPPRILAYFSLRDSRLIDQDGVPQGLGLNQPPPAFGSNFRKILEEWYCTSQRVQPKNATSPIGQLSMKELIGPLKCLYRGLCRNIPFQSSSWFSLVGTVTQSIPEQLYPWREAFRRFGLSPEQIDLLLRALSTRVMHAPRDIDLRINVPLDSRSIGQIEQAVAKGKKMPHSNLLSQWSNLTEVQRMQAAAVEKVAFLIFKGFAKDKLYGENLLNINDGIVLAEVEYFRAEPIKIKRDADGTMRRITRILHPEWKMRPPGKNHGNDLPVEVVLTGNLACRQLYHSSLRVQLDPIVFGLKQQPICYEGVNVWMGLFCLALVNCQVVDLSSVDEQAWCRLIQAYSEGQSCFRSSEESELKNILFQRAASVRNSQSKLPVSEFEVLDQITNWLQAYWKLHVDRDSVSFATLYYNASRSLNGYKPATNLISQDQSVHSFQASLLRALFSALPFDVLDSTLQLISILSIGLCVRESCPQIQLDYTADSFALRLWLEQDEIRRSLLIPINIPHAFAILEEACRHDLNAMVDIFHEFLPYLLSPLRTESPDAVAFLMELGLAAEPLHRLADLMLANEDPKAIHLGLLFYELVKKIDPNATPRNYLITRLPELLSALDVEQRQALLSSFERLFKHSIYAGLFYPSGFHLLETEHEIKFDLVQKLLQLSTSEVGNVLRILLVDPALDDKLTFLLQEVRGIDFALTLDLFCRVYKKISRAEFWHLVKDLGPIPALLQNESKVSLQRLAEIVFSDDLQPTIKADPYPPTLLVLLPHLASDKALNALTGMADDGFSRPQLVSAWLSALESAIGQDVDLVKKKIEFLLLHTQLLRSFSDQDARRLSEIIKRVQISAEKMQKAAENYLKNDTQWYAGLMLFFLYSMIFPENPLSLAPLKRLPSLLTKMQTEDDRLELWNFYGKIYSDQLTIFDSSIPPELCSSLANPVFSWISILMTSGYNALIALGQEMANQEKLTDSAIRISEKFLPATAQADFTAAVDLFSRLSSCLPNDRFYKLLDAILALRPSGIEQQKELLQKLTALVPKALESANTHNEPLNLIWLINQVEHLELRAQYLAKLPLPACNKLVAKAWLTLLQKARSLQMLALANKLSAPLLSLSLEDQAVLAACVEESLPETLSMNDLEQWLKFLQSYKLQSLIDVSQSLFTNSFEKLLEHGENLWKRLSPYLLDNTKFTLFPRYLSHIAPHPKAFADALGQYIRLNVSLDQQEQKFLAAASQLLSVRATLPVEIFVSLLCQLLTHCPVAFSEKMKGLAEEVLTLDFMLDELDVVLKMLQQYPDKALREKLTDSAYRCLLESLRLDDPKLDLIHSCAQSYLPYLSEDQRYSLWSSLIDNLHTAGNHHLAASCGAQWLDFNWIRPAQPDSVATAAKSIESALKIQNRQVACAIALHNKIALQLNYTVLLNLLEALVDPHSSRSTNQNIIDLLLRQPESYDDLFALLPRIEPLFELPVIRNFMQLCAPERQPELFSALFLQAANSKDYSHCLQILTAYKDEPWLLPVLANLLPNLMADKDTLNLARIMKILAARGMSLPIDKLNNVLVALLINSSKEAVELAIDLLETKCLLWLPVWLHLWDLLKQYADANLIQRAYQIFSAVEDNQWRKEDSSLLLDVWSVAILALASVYGQEPPAFKQRLLALNALPYPIQSKQCLWQQYFYWRLVCAHKLESPSLVNEVVNNLAELEHSVDALREEATHSFIQCTIVRVSFYLKMTQCYQYLVDMTINAFAASVGNSALLCARKDALIEIASSDPIITADQARALFLGLQEVIGNEERCLLIQLLSQYEEVDFSSEITELLKQLAASMDTYTAQNVDIYQQMLISLTTIKTLPPIELVRYLHQPIRDRIDRVGIFALIKLYLRYKTHLGALLGAHLLWIILQSDEPLDHNLCAEVCGQLQQLPVNTSGFAKYHQILQCRRTSEFIPHEVQIEYFVDTTTAQFHYILKQSKLEYHKNAIDWGYKTLQAYFGNANYIELTNLFLQILLTAQDLGDATPVTSQVQTLFEVADPTQASIFFKKDQFIKKLDFTLAMQVVNALLTHPAKVKDEAILRFELVKTFLTELSQVREHLLKPQLQWLPAEITRALVVYSTIPHGPQFKQEATQLFNMWRKRLGDYEVVAALALYNALPKTYEKFSLEQLDLACEFLTTLPSNGAINSAILLLNTNLSIILTGTEDEIKICQDELEPSILRLLSMASEFSHFTYVQKQTTFSLPRLVFGVIKNYYLALQAKNVAEDKARINRYSSILLDGLTQNIYSSKNFTTARDRFCDIMSILETANQLKWKPAIIPSYAPFIEKALLAFIPLMSRGSEIGKKYPRLPTIAKYLDQDELKPLYQKCADSLKQLCPGENHQRVEDWLKEFLNT